MCSRALVVGIKDTMIFLQRGMKIRTRPVAEGALMTAKYEIIETTFWLVIHAKDIGLTVMWDRGTRVQIQLESRFRGMIFSSDSKFGA